MADIYSELSWRGLIHQATDDALADWLGKESRTVYIGFDPTADSLHVGSLLQLMTLRRFQLAGHQPIALVGGATGMIGDPSGKSKERTLLTGDVLAANVAGIEEQMRSFLDFDGARPARLVNNLDWMRDFRYVDFLRDVGKNFPVNVMMAKDSVKSRLGREDTGISYTEFSYMLLQAYDFVHLHREFGCELQVGGSDQWGNITAGIDLARRMHGVQLYGITGPLLTKADGTKMGKTEEGTVWLSAEKTTPYEFYQYWVNVADEDVGRCLRFLTERSEDEIRSLDESRHSDPGKRESQKLLAAELTRLVHGDAGLETAERATKLFFGETITGWTDRDLSRIFADVPSCEISAQLVDEGFPLVDGLTATDLCKSKGEARRTIKEGGAYVNNERAADVELQLTRQHLASESVIVLRRGKRKFALVRLV
jgi:tyrosyl-tRNA synthetase